MLHFIFSIYWTFNFRCSFELRRAHFIFSLSVTTSNCKREFFRFRRAAGRVGLSFMQSGSVEGSPHFVSSTSSPLSCRMGPKWCWNSHFLCILRMEAQKEVWGTAERPLPLPWWFQLLLCVTRGEAEVKGPPCRYTFRFELTKGNSIVNGDRKCMNIPKFWKLKELMTISVFHINCLFIFNAILNSIHWISDGSLNGAGFGNFQNFQLLPPQFDLLSGFCR